MTVDYRVGDTRKVIAGIPDGSVDLIATSPPFLALRSYVPADHESKGDEIGSEANPAAFIDMLLGLTAEWGRVLAPHGSIAIELGDTYSGSGGGGGDYLPGGLRENQPGFGGSADRQRNGNAAHWRAKNQTPDAWPRAKSLALVPQLYAIALAYGINPLTGQASPTGRWLVRNVIVWHRPNPAVGALGDKVRPSTSYIVIATRSAKRWFDLSAVRTPYTAGTLKQYKADGDDPVGNQRPTINGDLDRPSKRGMAMQQLTHAGAPPLDAWFDQYDGTHDTWTLTTQPSRISVKVTTSVPCGPDDGGERTTSPDCPVHGDRPDLAPTARDGEPATCQSSRIPRSDDRHDLERDPVGSRDVLTSSHSGQPTATPHSTLSSRTDPARSTSQPDTPSVQRAASTARTSAPPELCGDRPDISESSNGEVCPPADEHETALGSDRKPDSESACSCTFHVDKPSIHSHYAMWPAKLAERLVLMMCPREVCRVCGEPRRRIEGKTPEYAAIRARIGSFNDHSQDTERGNGTGNRALQLGKLTSAQMETLGWTDCGCRDSPAYFGVLDDEPNYRPGHVLDPFAGSGTTLAVADLHGRDATGIDFDQRNHDLYPARHAEVKRALFGTIPELPGQGDLFGVPA